ncbi:uncharacterized protein LOC125035772 [Penaeus chinensis]|uniref:uncharacterized protein LOC125035772 n=1 Tax=Penaeus chinensis TaxID=139456 RepID=UPI001FB73421|nr:uncharacterized protein LOC125035772 [Penaeus chinensis]
MLTICMYENRLSYTARNQDSGKKQPPHLIEDHTPPTTYTPLPQTATTENHIYHHLPIIQHHHHTIFHHPGHIPESALKGQRQQGERPIIKPFYLNPIFPLFPARRWYRIGGLPNTEEKSINCTVYNYRDSDFTADLVVVSTDYTSFACLFSCYNFQRTHRAHFAWILSRSPTLPAEKIATCQKSLRKVGIPLGRLTKTNQDNCEYAGVTR